MKMSIVEALSVLGVENAENLARLDHRYQEQRESLAVADNVDAVRRLDDAFQVAKAHHWELEDLALIAAEKHTRANLVDTGGDSGWPVNWPVGDAGAWLAMGWSFAEARRWASARWAPRQVAGWADSDSNDESEEESTIPPIKITAPLPAHSGLEWAESGIHDLSEVYLLESRGWEPRMVAAIGLAVDELLAGEVAPGQVGPLVELGFTPARALDLVALEIEPSDLKGWTPDDIETLYGPLQFHGSEYLLPALLRAGDLDAAWEAWHSMQLDE